MKRSLLTALSAAAMVIAGANCAKADVITTLFSQVGGVYVYDVSLSSEQMTTTGAYFGTIYGFNFGSQPLTVTGQTLSMASNFGFNITSSLTRSVSAPPALGQGPNDNAFGLVGGGLFDIRYTYNDAATIGSFSGILDLGHFTLTSSYSTTAQSEYDGQANNSVGLGGNSHPILVAYAPEPVSVSLLGGGLAVLGLLRFRRK